MDVCDLFLFVCLFPNSPVIQGRLADCVRILLHQLALPPEVGAGAQWVVWENVHLQSCTFMTRLKQMLCEVPV